MLLDIHCPFPNCPLNSNQQTPFVSCKKCHLIFNIQAKQVTYENDYFNKEYKQQYGISYIADKKNIQLKARYRLLLLQKFITPHTHKNILELGSAMGFFLEVAQKAGFKVEGWEISQKMSQLANQNGLLTRTGNLVNLYSKQLQTLQKDKTKYNVIVAFYVIEHISDPFLVWRLFVQLLSHNGYLALSLPSYSGPTYQFHKNKWEQEHPIDHYVDYSIKSLKIIGKFFGFKLMSVYSEGIHPERFPLGNKPILRSMYAYIQDKTAFSDTIYAILKKI